MFAALFFSDFCHKIFSKLLIFYADLNAFYLKFTGFTKLFIFFSGKSWPCLHQWLETRPNKQMCPVCKAAISKEKVIPLYGRGSSKQEDPRNKVPPRPAGQRSEPESNGVSSFYCLKVVTQIEMMNVIQAANHDFFKIIIFPDGTFNYESLKKKKRKTF